MTEREGASSPVDEAILLCGGRGTRLVGDTEKPLVEVGRRSMVARVLAALAGSRIRRVVAVTSPHTPETTAMLDAEPPDLAGPAELAGSNVASGLTCELVVGSGDGYVDDLSRALAEVEGPAVSVAADLPLLCPRDVDDAIDAAASGVDGGARTGPGDGSTETDPGEGETSIDPVSVCVPVSLKRELGASVDTSFTSDGREVAPTGLNVVADGDDEVVVRHRERLAINVNRPPDLDLARRLADAN